MIRLTCLYCDAKIDPCQSVDPVIHAHVARLWFDHAGECPDCVVYWADVKKRMEEESAALPNTV